MRKKFVIIMAAATLVAAVILCGCSGSGTAESGADTGNNSGNTSEQSVADDEESPETVEITEKMFVPQINDIYTNPDLYFDATIKLEGLLDIYQDEATGEEWYFVYRYGPGCCGNDSLPGFEIELSGEVPAKDSWVEASGMLDTIDYDGQSYLILKKGSVRVLDERGAEYVE